MMSLILSALLNILLVLAFIADRVFRLRSIKEYREAKEAQIETLKQQVELERSNNDVQITDMHKKRYENLKLILDEKETELHSNHATLLELQAAIQDNKEKTAVINLLIRELNVLEKKKQDIERKKKALLGESY